LYIEHIPVNIVNEQLYPSVSMGFNDTNPLVRETTIKVLSLFNKISLLSTRKYAFQLKELSVYFMSFLTGNAEHGC